MPSAFREPERATSRQHRLAVGMTSRRGPIACWALPAAMKGLLAWPRQDRVDRGRSGILAYGTGIVF